MNSKTAKVEAVRTEDKLHTVWLTAGRILSLPLVRYPSLLKATTTVRELWQPSGAGQGIHWPTLDYDLSVEGLLEGQHKNTSAARYVVKTRKQNKLTKKSLVRATRKRTLPPRKSHEKL